jgi:hypothetical protein
MSRFLHRSSIAVLAVIAVLGSASTAHAGLWQWTDDFSGTPNDRWEAFHGGGDGGAGFNINLGFGHNGHSNNGWLYAANGWAFMRIAHGVNVGNRSDCAAAMYMKPVGGGAQVGLQVWNPNGWHLIAETYPWLDGSDYQQVYVTGMNLEGVDTVYIQAIYGNSSGSARFIRLDDVALQCYY